MRAAPLAFAVLVLLSAGCSNRDRNNPFDPGNPETGGKPPDFRAIADDRKNTLRWGSVVSPSLVGYELLRRAPGDSGFVFLTTLPPEQSSYVDSFLTNDSTYAYRLRFVLDSGRRGAAADAIGRPGTAIVWVADAASGFIYRVAPDGRAIFFGLPGLETPGFVGVEPVQNRVWSSSREQGIVAVWNASGQLVDVDGTFAAPGKIAPIPGTNVSWVADERSGQVVRFEIGNGVLSSEGGFRLPSDVIAVTGGAWVADREGRKLVHMLPTGGSDFELALPDKPWRIAADGVSGDLWISYTEANAIECRTATGTLRFRANDLEQPFTLAVDNSRSIAWVVLSGGAEAVAYDRFGALQGHITGLSRPRGLAVDPRNGEVWVTTLGVGDGGGSLWHFDAAGNLISELPHLGRPSAVELDTTL